MASEEKRELLKAIAPVLKDAGFKKKDATWRRTKDGFIQIFNVQGSQWSKSFYFNLGVYITALGEDKAPLEHDSHIRNRADNLATDRERYGQLLDLENDIPADERYKELAELIESRVIPWLEEFSDHQRIVEWITGEQPHGLPVRHSVYDHYGIPRRTKQNKPLLDKP